MGQLRQTYPPSLSQRGRRDEEARGGVWCRGMLKSNPMCSCCLGHSKLVLQRIQEHTHNHAQARTCIEEGPREVVLIDGVGVGFAHVALRWCRCLRSSRASFTGAMPRPLASSSLASPSVSRLSGPSPSLQQTPTPDNPPPRPARGIDRLLVVGEPNRLGPCLACSQSGPPRLGCGHISGPSRFCGGLWIGAAFLCVGGGGHDGVNKS